jgi:hypothetical protein
VNDGSENKSDSIKIVMREGIGLLIVAEVEGFSLSHQIHGVCSESDVDYFHKEEVEASPNEYKVDVSGYEDNQEQLLSFVRETLVRGRVPMTFLLARILRISINMASRWRKSPII